MFLNVLTILVKYLVAQTLQGINDMKNLYIDSDTLYEIETLTNARTDALINNATITVQLFRKGSSVQIGVDIVMTPVGSLGNYWCVIPNSNTLYKGDEYYITVTIVSGEYQLTKKIELLAVWSE